MGAYRWLWAFAVPLFMSVAEGGLAGLGQVADDQTSLGYNARTGELWVDAPSGQQLAAIQIASRTASFTFSGLAQTSELAELLVCPRGEDCPEQSIFLAAFGEGFGSLDLGEVLLPGLPPEFLLEDLSVAGSLAGNGELGPVDLIYIPEPGGLALAAVGLAGLSAAAWRSRRRSGLASIG